MQGFTWRCRASGCILALNVAMHYNAMAAIGCIDSREAHPQCWCVAAALIARSAVCTAVYCMTVWLHDCMTAWLHDCMTAAGKSGECFLPPTTALTAADMRWWWHTLAIHPKICAGTTHHSHRHGVHKPMGATILAVLLKIIFCDKCSRYWVVNFQCSIVPRESPVLVAAAACHRSRTRIIHSQY